MLAVCSEGRQQRRRSVMWTVQLLTLTHGQCQRSTECHCLLDTQPYLHTEQINM